MSEVNYDYIVQYLRALRPETTGVLNDIESAIYQKEANWPIIKPEVSGFINVLLSIIKPQKILEIGTNVGYSSIYMSKVIDAHITTIERNSECINQAMANIKKEGLEDKISILEGDAINILQTLDDVMYDVVFMDCAKGQYINLLPDCLRVLNKGGVLIADNVLHKGAVAKSRYHVERRQRTTHKRLREFLWNITHDDMLNTSIVPIGDGVSISFKKEQI
ncbi:MAG: methyltransferase [Epulopiscium sp. Nuni2H_MBin003]|nr:MAG: methyltransferase [Epulopiscium sp. Nuni2H_MBin003]